MRLLQAGFPKSGNWWLYQIIQGALRQSGHPRRSFARQHPIYAQAVTWENFAEQAEVDYLEINAAGNFFRKGAYVEPIPDLGAFIDQCEHVWTHAYWSPQTQTAFEQFDKIVYIIRDGRDVVVSASKFFFTPFMRNQHAHGERSPEEFLQHRLAEMLLSWVQHVGGTLLHAGSAPLHIVFYERLLVDFDTEFDRLLAFLEIELAQAQRQAVRQAVQFETMHAKNPHHVRKGQRSQWVSALTAKQIRQCERIGGPLLALLGYPDMAGDLSDAGLPGLAGDIMPEQVAAAIRLSRGTWRDQLEYAGQFLASRRPLEEKLRKGVGFLRGGGRWSR